MMNILPKLELVHQEVLHYVSECLASFQDAVMQDIQSTLEENNLGSIPRNVRAR
jgi:hypothetical protein